MSGPPLLVARGITRVLGEGAGRVHALKGVDLTLRGGELTLLMGPSGSGKTTLLSILGCLLMPTSGRLMIGSDLVTGLDPERLASVRRKLIGFVFQSYNLFPMLTVEDNIRLALDVRGKGSRRERAGVRQALGEVGLSDKVRAYPGHLSGGQKQRVAIARALSGSPAVILADEPTSALDGENGLAIMKLLATIAKDPNRAVLAVTHDPRTLPYADRIFHIEDGRIVGEEEPRKMTDQVAAVAQSSAHGSAATIASAPVGRLASAPPPAQREPEPPQDPPRWSRQSLARLAMLAALAAVLVWQWDNLPRSVDDVQRLGLAAWHKVSPEPPPPAPAVAKWAAVAPGRIEARHGEVRISAAMLGRVVDLPFRVGDAVEAGDPLVLLDDEEAQAQVRAADAETRSAKRERDKISTNSQRETDQRKAEDKLESAQRKLWTRRVELDRVVQTRRDGFASDQQVTEARAKVEAATAEVGRSLQELNDLKEGTKSPAPVQVETVLALATAKLAAAEAQLEKTRIRAPTAGSVLQVNAKIGETVAPSPDQVLVVIGDLKALRVRTEVSERDVAKLTPDNPVTVKVDAFPDREFAGKVTSMAPALSPPKIGPRDPRKPLDIDILEVMVELEPAKGLVPGMRADVFFKLP